MRNIAVVIGATGLVGANLVRLLLADSSFSEVKIIVRRKGELTHQKLTEIIVKFDQLEAYKRHFTGDVLFSCMGTTIKTAGTKDAQYTVDFTYQNRSAQLARDNGMSSLVLVSSTGANSDSMMFYSRIKGDLEMSVEAMGFAHLIIVRPSLLIGFRPKKRRGEVWSSILLDGLMPILPFLKKYRGIKGSEVARALVQLFKSTSTGKTVVELDELFKYSQ
ncbi:MAG: hypothetical protein ACI85Q_001302 [Salibacteraceae bacterium]|jgi:uncharacterized protein YbjT (DUF2867 family)